MKSKKWKKIIIVVDNECGMCKAEFTKKDILRVVFPSNVGKQKHTSIMVEMW